MRSPWASPADPHMIGEMYDADPWPQTDQELRDIERRHDEPPDEPHPRYEDEDEDDEVFPAADDPVIA